MSRKTLGIKQGLRPFFGFLITAHGIARSLIPFNRQIFLFGPLTHFHTLMKKARKTGLFLNFWLPGTDSNPAASGITSHPFHRPTLYPGNIALFLFA